MTQPILPRELPFSGKLSHFIFLLRRGVCTTGLYLCTCAALCQRVLETGIEPTDLLRHNHTFIFIHMSENHICLRGAVLSEVYEVSLEL